MRCGVWFQGRSCGSNGLDAARRSADACQISWTIEGQIWEDDRSQDLSSPVTGPCSRPREATLRLTMDARDDSSLGTDRSQRTK
jgi:hypothetical protein